MKVSYNWVQKYFAEPLPDPQTLTDLFTDHTFEVEDVEKKGDDTVFEAKVLPDRAHYLLSHKGVAREASVITGLKLNDVHGVKSSSVLDDKPGIKVVVEDSNLCRRYIAQTIEGVTVEASPDWLKTALESLGQKSINSIVDVGNYIMFDVGQPLHAFDADKIEGGICVRKATADEKIILLTGEEVTLTTEDLVIADEVGPLAIAGVKGGKRSGVTVETKRLILEAANFDPVAIRKTSTRLNLRNDSSKRFENEITPALAEEGREKFVTLLTQLYPDLRLNGVTDFYPSPVNEWEVKVTAKKISSLVGLSVTEEKIKETMTAMGCRVSIDTDVLTVVPPLDRLDIVTPEDVADEVGRMIGYEKIPAVLPPTLTEVNLPNKTFFYAEKVKNFLVNCGYSEALLYSLVAKGFFNITYPLASDKSALRESLLPKLTESLISNGRNADLLNLETIKICEVGKVFRTEGEKTYLALGVLQIKKKKGVFSEAILESDIEQLIKGLDKSFVYKIETGPYGAVVEIDFDQLVSELSKEGQLSELDFKPLPEDIKYQKFSAYPYIVRDVAVFVPEATAETEIQNVIREKAGSLCLQINLFDVFVKDFPEGTKKSCAFRLIFQSFERTLEDTEVNAIMDGVYKNIAAKSDWEIR